MSEVPPVLALLAFLPIIVAVGLLLQVRISRAFGRYYQPKTATEFCELVARKAGCSVDTVWDFFHDNEIRVGDPAYGWTELDADYIANELMEDY